MREHMVNGQSWSEVLDILQNSKPKKKKKMKFEFIPVGEYIRLLDKYVGVTNYSVEYSDFSYVKISSGQDMLSIKCKITILDDDGNVVVFKEGMGGSEFSYSSDNGGRDVNLRNSPVTAQQSAFKTAAKALGCFDFYGTYGEEDEESSSAASEDAKAAKNKPKANYYLCHSAGKFFNVNDGKNTRKLPVHLGSEDKVSEIIFYADKCSPVKDRLNDIAVKAGRGPVSFEAYLRPCGERDGKNQYTFLKLKGA